MKRPKKGTILLAEQIRQQAEVSMPCSEPWNKGNRGSAASVQFECPVVNQGSREGRSA